MKPVLQTRFVAADTTLAEIDALPGEQRGNCLQAAVASLFELALDDVPHFVAEDDWWGCFEGWLARRNLLPVWISEGHQIPWGIDYLATGTSPRGAFKHVVIERNGELVHDPHPSGAGLLEREGIYYFVVRDPSAFPEQD